MRVAERFTKSRTGPGKIPRARVPAEQASRATRRPPPVSYTHLPKRDELVQIQLNEQLIVELYSK